MSILKAPVKNQNDEVINLVGFRLREIRKENGWTLSEVSKRTGISKGTLSKLENGKTQLNFSSVNKLASGLQLPVSDLTNPHSIVSGKRAVTRALSGTVFESVDMDYEVLCSDIDNAQQGFIRAVVKAKAVDSNLPHLGPALPPLLPLQLLPLHLPLHRRQAGYPLGVVLPH